MKNIKATLLLALISLSMNAQRVIEKNLDYSGQAIALDVKFASEIEVRTWDKQSVYLKATLQTEEGKYLDLYELDVQEREKEIRITSNAEPVFKQFHEEWKREHPDQKYRSYNGDMYDFQYVMFIPKGTQCKVSSINGNLKATIFEGDLTTDLINGNIDIARYKGTFELSTINGEIDLKMSNTSLVAETIHGNIYADESLDLKTTDKHIGQKVEGNFDNPASNLRLNTINGNMYLRL
jgi:hypothetical protein